MTLTDFVYFIIIRTRSVFYHNFVDIISKNTLPQKNASKHLGSATFILRHQQLHRKLVQKIQNKFWIFHLLKSLKRSTLGGLRFYSQNIRLNRFKAGKKRLVSSCVGIVEAIIAWTIEAWFSITLLFSWDCRSRKSTRCNKCQKKGYHHLSCM